jgi:putative transcriptional regulator
MITSTHHGYLQGRLLVATPNIMGDHFSKSVILLFAHSEEGAMGIILNHPLRDVTYQDMFTQLALEDKAALATRPIHYGGPVEVNRGFLIYDHEQRFEKEAMVTVGEIGISASLEMLQRIAEGTGPARHLLALGYAGWAPGQLESEIAENSWFSVPLDVDLVFSQSAQAMWQQAANLQGVDMSKFSTLAGHA